MNKLHLIFLIGLLCISSQCISQQSLKTQVLSIFSSSISDLPKLGDIQDYDVLGSESPANAELTSSLSSTNDCDNLDFENFDPVGLFYSWSGVSMVPWDNICPSGQCPYLVNNNRLTSHSFDVQGSSEAMLSFTVRAESGNWPGTLNVLASANGGSYTFVGSFTQGVDFNHSSFTNVSVNIPSQFLTGVLKLRIEQVYVNGFRVGIDDIKLDVCSSGNCNIGSSCNDGDSCTINDVIDVNCNCTGTFQDSDNDGVCNANDICPQGDDNIDSDGDGIPDACDGCNNLGDPCNDGDACTINDVLDANCNCSGTYQDSDNDGVCDAEDVCPGGNDTIDSDGDGIPDACDGCDNAGNPCNDGDSCTVNDVFDANCNCAGTYQDSDNDGVCNANDVCPGGDDTIDSDGDGIPDACDGCDNAGNPCNDGDACTVNDVLDANCNCAGTYQDSDNDGVCNANDVCPGGDDTIDSDGDGIPDFCDQSDECDEPISEMTIIDGDLKLDGACYSVIMQSENGSCFRVTVLNNGQISSTPVDCD